MLGYLTVLLLVFAALTPVIFVEIFADSFNLDFDEKEYSLGDTLTISGEVVDFGMPIIAMSVYDPDGKILSANNLEISPDGIFSKSILLESPFYEKTGEYEIQLDYGKISETFSFYIENNNEPKIFDENLDIPEILLLYTDKKQYTDNEKIKITGFVSVLDSPTVLIGIYDPFGTPAGFYFGNVDEITLEFSTEFLVKSGVNFRMDGTYSIKAHYAESESITYFDFFENLESQDTQQDTQQ
ncbi:MAG: tetratricopeptide repeat protein, partial [Nitrosopumilus sp.]